MSEQYEPGFGPPGAGCVVEQRAELGSYVLGALDPTEADLVRGHLLECVHCRAEYRELAAVPGVLARITETEMAIGPVPPGEELLARLLDRAAAQEGGAVAEAGHAAGARGRRRSADRQSRTRLSDWFVGSPRRWSLVGAGAALACASVLGVYAATSGGPAPQFSKTIEAGDTASGINGTVDYHSAPWGSWVQATMHNVPPGDDCSLVAVDAKGDRVVASTWYAPSSGVATIPGAVAMEADTIVKFEVVASTGTLLLNIPVH